MYKLTKEGEEYLKNGLPERQLLNFILNEKPLEEVSKLPKSEIAVGWARKNEWIIIENKIVKLSEKGKNIINKKTDLDAALEKIDKGNEISQGLIKILLSRKLIEETKKIIKPEKPGFFSRLFGKKKEENKSEVLKTGEIAQLTPDLIKSGEWKNKTFRKYDVNAPAPKIYPGKKQPYIQFLEDIKERLIGLGFQEMRGPLIETSFWNCDALFIPQDHPAKSLHDLFYIKTPSKGKLPDENLIAKVKATHEGGWITESSGWGGVWNKEEATKLVLRSHTTAVSARTLFKNKDKPAKYFTINRNFRPEAIDAGHLMEFYQCEGIVIGENLTFRHLLGFLKEIAEAVGLKEVKFKPGFFPYTEPSVEGFVKHPTVGWIETLAAGMFRPELLRPLGVEKSQVLAWGLGIGRLAMAKLGIEDIRMLFSEDLEWLRKTPLVK
ncbi:MAG: phenylalanine--tRNA ligase subunit alpha [Candidatus Aenigmarchaeota archaeon]|nr:phenylalanine--tRNA ligase subunit alpha [Candidatus Aenigmarchaeota archaeon]